MDDDLRERVESALGETHEIEQELAPGGMSRLFLARERSLQRRVVIKVIPSDVLHARTAARFRRETQLVAQLSHPHVVPILSAGEIADMLYYVMPYVDGESLRAKLAREGQLAIDEAVAIATEAAGALDFAHRQGIVHRDVKPENILLKDGHALVADFGLARMLGADPSLTGTDVTVGTPAYISPEQATSAREVDGRSDIYSLACVLFEMLAGEPPFTGHSTQTVIAKRFVEAPPSVRVLRDTVPPELDRVLCRAMARAPADRFATAGEFATALGAAARAGSIEPVRGRGWLRSRSRRVAVAVAAGLLAVTGVAYAAVPRELRAHAVTLLWRNPASLSPHRVVVAPLENRTGDSTFDVLGDMAADWIAQGLLQSGEFQVVDPRTAILTSLVVERIPRFLRARDPAVALASEVGAGTVLFGSYFLDGDSIRIRVSALDVATRTARRAITPVATPVAAPVQAMPLLAERASGLVAIATDTTPAASVRTSVPPSHHAYRAMTSGWTRFVAARDTVALFAGARRAQQIDSAYLAPLLFEAFGRAYYRQWRLVDSLLLRVQPRYGELTEQEARAFDLLRAQTRTDNEQQLEAARALLAVMPGSPEAIVAVVLTAWDVNRPYEALRVLSTVPPDRGVFLVTDIHWQYRAYSLHLIGDYNGQQRTALEGRRRHPDFYANSNDRVRALAARGDIRGLERHLGERVVRGDSTEIKRVWRLTEAAQELRVHGHTTAARRIFESLAADNFVLGDTGRSGAVRRANVFYDVGRWSDARGELLELFAADPENVEVRGHLGAVAARLGRTDEAAQFDQWLARRDNRYLHGLHTYWRARIAAAGGDPGTATQLLERAFAEGYPMNRHTGLTEVHLTSDFAGLPAFPPFARLMRPRR